MAYQIQGSVIINDDRELVNVGASTISTLSVTSATTTEDLTVNGTVNGTAGILTSGVLDGDISIGGSITVSDNVNVDGDILLSGDLQGPAELIIDPAPVGNIGGAVRIRGDLYVEGTEFIVDSENVLIKDKKIGVASDTSTELLLDGAGIGIGSANVEKTFLYNQASDTLQSSVGLSVASGEGFNVLTDEVLNLTTLGATVVNSSLTSVGSLTDLTVTGDITANGNIVGDAATNISGIASVTADNFYGDGSGLTNLPASGIDLSGTDQSFRHVEVTGAGVGLTVTNDLEVGGTATIDTLILTNALGFVNATEAVIGVATVTTLDVNGLAELVDVQVSGAASITGDLTVGGALNLTGDITLDDANVESLVVTVGPSTFTGNVGLNDNLDVTGTVAIGGTVSFATTAYFETDTITTGETVGFGSAFFGDILANNLSLAFGNLTGDGNTNISGIASVTATNFYGDGSGLTNLPASGIDLSGTDQSFRHIQVTGAGVGLTVTNNAEIGGTLEVTGLTTLGNADIDNIFVTTALSTPLLSVTDSIVGVTTFAGDVNLEENLVGDGATNISGIASVTATNFYGDGSGLTGISGDANSVLVADNQDNTDYPMVFASAVGAAASIYSDSTTSFEFTYNPSTGTATAATFDSVSDERLKDNITQIADPIAKLSALRGVEFDWKGIEGSSVGVIAQDVAKVYPQLVTDHGERLTVNYDGLVGLLVRAVQELTARVEELEGK